MELQAAAARVPDELLLAETDSPFLAPVPLRGRPNTPANVLHTLAFLAGLRGVDAGRAGRADRAQRGARVRPAVSTAALALALSAALCMRSGTCWWGAPAIPSRPPPWRCWPRVAVGLPLAVATWDVQPGVAPWVAASAVLELAYIVLLAAAYRRADVSVIYPIARGAAPVLVLLAAIGPGSPPGRCSWPGCCW